MPLCSSINGLYLSHNLNREKADGLDESREEAEDRHRDEARHA